MSIVKDRKALSLIENEDPKKMGRQESNRNKTETTGGEIPISLPEAVKEWKVSRNTFYRAFSDGRLTKYKLGSKTYVLPSELRALFQVAT